MTVVMGKKFNATFHELEVAGTSITSILDGEPLKGATVEVNGEIVGETPYVGIFEPGKYYIKVFPPKDIDCIEAEYSFELTAGIEGADIKAVFHSP